MAKSCLYISLFLLSALFLLLSIGGIILFSNIDYFINQQIKKQAPLVNGSKPFQSWSKPKEDTSFKFSLYLFNVQNPDGYLNGEKPILKEIGPFEFKQRKIFTIIGWENNENKLNYKMERQFYRDQTCKGDLNQEITILNVPLISFANLIKSKLSKLNKAMRYLAEVIVKERLGKPSIFIKQKAGDLLFNGYRDDFTKNIASLENALKRFKFKIDGPTAIDKDGYFSLLGQKNNSDYGLWTIDTGKENLEELGKLIYLDGKDKIAEYCWTGNCSSIHGTDGIIHHPFIKDNDILSVFEPELNRTVYLNYERETQYQGIPTKRFVLSENTYASPKFYSNNACFCKNKDDGIMDYNGTLRSSHCNFDVPLVFSNPHFYQADKYFRDRIKGLKPIKEQHESFADVSKELGMVLNGRKTVQVNFDTAAYSYYIDESSKGKPINREIFPVFWLSDSGSAGPSSVDQLKEELYDKVSNIKKYLIIFNAIFIAGFLVVIIYLTIDVTLLWNARIDSDRQHIINSENFSNNEVNNDIHAHNDKNLNDKSIEAKEECHDSAVEV